MLDRATLPFAGCGRWLFLLPVLATIGCAGPKISLFNGKNLDGWECQQSPHENTWQVAGDVSPDPADETKLLIEPGTGILVNGHEGKTCNLYTERKYGDCIAHIEFMVPEDSNSGVYFMGKYEVQVLDSYGKEEVTFSDCGGIYARWINDQNVDGQAPMVNASKPPGEWQSFDVKFVAPRFNEVGVKIENARFVWVKHNGTIVQKDVELKGPTRAAMPGPETVSGPLMLQGDHGPVAYRNLWIRPLE